MRSEDIGLPKDCGANLDTIIGVDPGTRISGFGVIRKMSNAARWEIVDAGAWQARDRIPLERRIAIFHEQVYQLCQAHRPAALVLEKAFAYKNISSALRLGEVRGAFIAAAGRANTPVQQMSPAEIKKLIAGNGRAGKDEVARGLQCWLDFRSGGVLTDVSDALAIALAFGLTQAGPQGLPAAMTVTEPTAST